MSTPTVYLYRKANYVTFAAGIPVGLPLVAQSIIHKGPILSLVVPDLTVVKFDTSPPITVTGPASIPNTSDPTAAVTSLSSAVSTTVTVTNVGPTMSANILGQFNPAIWSLMPFKLYSDLNFFTLSVMSGPAMSPMSGPAVGLLQSAAGTNVVPTVSAPVKSITVLSGTNLIVTRGQDTFTLTGPHVIPDTSKSSMLPADFQSWTNVGYTTSVAGPNDVPGSSTVPSWPHGWMVGLFLFSAVVILGYCYKYDHPSAPAPVRRAPLA